MKVANRVHVLRMVVWMNEKMAGIGPPPPPSGDEPEWLKAAREQEAKRFAKRKRPGEEDEDEDEPHPKIQRAMTPFELRKEAFFQQLKTLPLGDIFNADAAGTVAAVMLQLVDVQDTLWIFASEAPEYPGRDRVREVVLQGATARLADLGSRIALSYHGADAITDDFKTAHPLQTKLMQVFLTNNDFLRIISEVMQAEEKVRDAFKNEVAAKLRDRQLRLRDTAVYEIKTYDPLGRFNAIPEHRKRKIILPLVYRAYMDRRKREDADVRRRQRLGESDAKRSSVAAELMNEEAKTMQATLEGVPYYYLTRMRDAETEQIGFLSDQKLQMLSDLELQTLVKEEIERREQLMQVEID